MVLHKIFQCEVDNQMQFSFDYMLHYLAFMVQEPRYYHLCYVKLSILVSHFEAGLVSLVVFRDVFLVGGAVFLRANSLGWKV